MASRCLMEIRRRLLPGAGRHLLPQFTGLNLIAVVLGVLAGYAVVFFRLVIDLFRRLFFEGGAGLLSPLGRYYVVLLPAIGGLLVGYLVSRFAPETRGEGPADVIEAISLRGGRIRHRVFSAKILATGLSIGSGGSAGPEGPVVQICSSLGSSLGQLLGVSERELKVLIGSGSAAGIAATFNAPIAGVLFAMEVILTEFKTRFFVPIVISAIFGTIVSRYYLGSTPAFTVPAYSRVSLYELLFYLLLGLISGVVAVIFIESNCRTEDLFKRLGLGPVPTTALGGLSVGLLGLFYPQIFGIGYETIDEALLGKMTFGLLLALVFLKIAGASLTLGSGGSGGAFAPSLFVGAMTGGAFGSLAHSLFPTITASPGAYALLGMAAVFAGTTLANLTAIILVFEMSGSYSFILPLMLACVVSDGFVAHFYKDSIYTKTLKRKGVLYRRERMADALDLIPTREVMAREVVTVPEETEIREVSRIMRETHYHGFPVLDREGRLTGLLTHHEVENAILEGLDGAPAKQFMITHLVVGHPDETLRHLLSKIGPREISHIPIVEREDPHRLVGFITKSDITRAYIERSME